MIVRVPFGGILYRQRKPSTRRQHWEGLSPSRTTSSLARRSLTLTGNSRMVFRSSSESVVTLSSFRMSRLREWCGIFRSITLGGSTGLSQSPAPGTTVADDNGQRIIERKVQEPTLSCGLTPEPHGI